MPHPWSIIASKILEMISENTYFEGKVKSLGYSTVEGKSTVGVMEAGEYKFNTDGPESMTVIQGKMEVSIAGSSVWDTYAAGSTYEVPGQSFFTVKIDVQTSYLCRY